MSAAGAGTARIQGATLEYRWVGEAKRAANIVFLHEGLGSVSMWRDFPERLAAKTGRRGLVYSRRGYGASSPVEPPRPVSFMHHEALDVLPAVLAYFDLDDVILFGHSDGASIAIIYAGAKRGPVRSMVLEAPHVFVEPVCIESITQTHRTYETTDLGERLSRHHGANTDAMFRSWTDVWLRPEFRAWNIEEYLKPITVPLLAIQGEDDEYGTLAQLEAVSSQVSGPAQRLVLPRCGHSPHRDQPEAVLEAAASFIKLHSA
jgi:pimeloyl-ACP methyl ester carboxylesterase